MGRLTVVVPTFRGLPWVRTCLRSVLESRGVTLRVVVFDNASTDGTRDIVANEFPEVELIASRENVGFARANNRVIRRAISRGDDYVFLLNEDARVDPDTLATLIAVAEKHDVSILSPLQYDYQGEKFESDFDSLVRQEHPSRLWTKTEFVPTSRIIGAAVLLRLSTIRRIGLFDPAYFIYAEEEDLCRRALSHGYRVGIAPQTRIYHGHKSTSNFLTLERSRRFNMIRGKYILALKNPQQSMSRSVLVFVVQVARDLKAVFETHSLSVVWDFILASLQVMSSFARIRRRRKLERELSADLWTKREMGIDDEPPDSTWTLSSAR
jgi:GT2 family glycosyltransferase